MTKDELVKHMETVLAEIKAQDFANWEELKNAGQYEEIELDICWHNGYASAIQTVKEML